MRDVFPLLVLLLSITDSLVMTDLRGIMFDFATGLGHRHRKRREIKSHIYSNLIDFITLRKLSVFVKKNGNIFKKYYKLHSILLKSLPLQYIMILIAYMVDKTNMKIPVYLCAGFEVIKTVILIILYSKVDASYVSKYAKKYPNSDDK